jgi:parvulin-like peptidyl-prolyl isomerase
VATVNNQAISTRLYQMYLKNGREALGLDEKTEAGRNKIDQLREGIVSELIDRVLVAQEAQRRGLSIPADKLAAAEQRSINQFGGEGKYDEYLAEHHLSRDEYREVVKWEVYGEMMRGELSKDISVSDAEVKEYYEAHKGDANFQLSERVSASHVLVAARPNLIAQQLKQEKNLDGEALAAAVRVEMDQRRKRAEELRRKADAGADFASLALQSSDDPGTRPRGGDLGTFGRESHPKAFDDAAFALAPGKVSQVVQTDYGFHVIKVFSREAARAQTLAEATSEVRNALLGKREAEKLTKWLKEARRKASIHINEPFRFGALKTEFAQLSAR